jgi:hypothetical protein
LFDAAGKDALQRSKQAYVLMPNAHRQDVDVQQVARRLAARAEFEGRDHLHVILATGGDGFIDAEDGVVVGERDDAHATRGTQRHQRGRRIRAIGGGAVELQIDRVVHGASTIQRPSPWLPQVSTLRGVTWMMSSYSVSVAMSQSYLVEKERAQRLAHFRRRVGDALDDQGVVGIGQRQADGRVGANVGGAHRRAPGDDIDAVRMHDMPNRRQMRAAIRACAAEPTGVGSAKVRQQPLELSCLYAVWRIRSWHRLWQAGKL